jgi:hypothetical protein
MHIWISLAVGAAAVVMFVLAVRHAPLGYEDREGFHFGREPSLIPVTSKSERHELPRIRALRARQTRPDEIAA